MRFYMDYFFFISCSSMEKKKKKTISENRKYTHEGERTSSLLRMPAGIS